MIADDYPLGFKVVLHRKDLRIAIDLADESGVDMPVASLAADLEDGLIEAGHGDDDMSALARPLRARAGLG
jgi:3-hydroxyisobutyrate dehydrogenase